MLVLLSFEVIAQNNSLVIKGNGVTKPFVVLNGGSLGSPIYLVINNSNAAAIARTGTDPGWIISEAEFNYLKWNIKTSSAGTFTVPFGVSTTSDIPLSFTVTSAGVGASGNILFSTYGTGISNTPFATRDGVNPIPVLTHDGLADELFVADRWWILDAKDYSTKPAIDLTLTYTEPAWAPGNTITEENLQAQRYDNSNTTSDGSGWESGGAYFLLGTDVPLSNIVSGIAISSAEFFRAWVLTDKTEPLPINLLSFEAKCNSKSVDLFWTTATETNNSFFTVQRSLDAQYFEDVISIPGAGNSNSLINYHISDEYPYNSQAYYRLKQTDYDGNFTYSSLVAVENCNSETPSYNVFYNRTDGSINVILNGNKDIPYTVSLFDMLGQQLISGTSKQLVETSMDVSSLSYGIYLVVVNTDSEIYTTKVYISR